MHNQLIKTPVNRTLPFSLLPPRLILFIAVKPPIVEGIAPNPNTHIPQNTTTQHENKYTDII